jgi:alkanesulfonate monooxygenase SsuD/methylene tetrahydromethanopterin reductase-like flavin-dependent oxidoreductase (luciferase family)
MSQKDEWVREGGEVNWDASHTQTQSSAAGCGTIASESAQVCASVWAGPCVGTTIGAQTTNRHFSFTFRPPISIPAPPPSPAPPTKNIVFCTHSPRRNSWLAPRYGYYFTSTHKSSLMSSLSASKPLASPPEVGIKSEITIKSNLLTLVESSRQGPS